MGTYRAQFRSLKGVLYVVEIMNPNISGRSITLGEDCVHMRCEAQDNKYPGLRTTELEISVLSDSPMVELYGSDIFATTVVMYHYDDSVLDGAKYYDFVGFLEASEWQQPCTPGRVEEKQLVAVDAVSAYLQAKYFERKLINAKDTLLQIVRQISQRTGVSCTYYGTMLQSGGIWDVYISTDALQPDDLFTPHNADEDWTTLANIMDEFAKGTGTTVQMVGNTVNVYKIDDIGQMWCTSTRPTEENLAGEDMTCEIVPPVRCVKHSADRPDNIPDPELVHTNFYNPVTDGWEQVKWGSKYVRVFYGNGSSQWNVRPWVKGPNWPPTTSGKPKGNQIPARLTPVIALQYASETYDLDTKLSGDCIAAFDAVTAKEAMHVMIPAESTLMPSNYLTVAVVAQILVDNALQSHKNYDYEWLPTDSVDSWSDTESAKTDTAIALRCNGKTIDPVHVVYKNPSGNEGRWQEVKYTFHLLTDDYLADNGVVQVYLRSDWGRDLYQTTAFGDFALRFKCYNYCKKVEFVHGGYNEDADSVEKEISASGSDNAKSMSLDAAYTLSAGCKGSILRHTASYYCPDPLQQLAHQYAAPHVLWSADVDDRGFTPIAKTHCRGRLCTVTSFDWNVRYGRVTATMLEDA